MAFKMGKFRFPQKSFKTSTTVGRFKRVVAQENERRWQYDQKNRQMSIKVAQKCFH